MKLGIAVVYLVSEENGPLLDLHLRQIERFTTVPYTIYASINRLRPEFQGILEKNPKVKVCDCAPTDLRGALEHAYYLEHLIQRAIQDGVTHVAILHIDSFPVKTGWIEELAERLSEKRPYAAVETAYTAGLFFPSSFYLDYHPTLQLSETEKASASYQKFVGVYAPIEGDSGIGYLYRAYLDGLDYYRLPRTSKAAGNALGMLYDDLIFHLTASVLLGTQQAKKPSVWEKCLYRAAPLLRAIRWQFAAVFPKNVVNRIGNKTMPLPVVAQRYQLSKAELLADPDGFIERLRNSK
jgi:hypothetical protein